MLVFQRHESTVNDDNSVIMAPGVVWNTYVIYVYTVGRVGTAQSIDETKNNEKNVSNGVGEAESSCIWQMKAMRRENNNRKYCGMRKETELYYYDNIILYLNACLMVF